MSQETPLLLSVVMPVYNVELYLEDALDSVCRQNMDNFELIGINDGSTDRSGEILEEYSRSDERVKVIHTENAGLSAARNRGLSMAEGEYVYFLDSDDVVVDGAFDYFQNQAQKGRRDILCISGEYINQKGELITNKPASIKPNYQQPVAGEWLLTELYKQGCYTPLVLSYIFNRFFLEEHKLYFDKSFIHEDEAYTPKALCLAESVVSTSSVCYRHRIRPDSIMTTKKSEKNVQGWTRAVSRILSFIREQELSEETKYMLSDRSKSLLSNAIVLTQRLNREEGRNLHITEYLSNDEIRQLGNLMWLKAHIPALVQLHRSLSSIIRD